MNSNRLASANWHKLGLMQPDFGPLRFSVLFHLCLSGWWTVLFFASGHELESTVRERSLRPESFARRRGDGMVAAFRTPSDHPGNRPCGLVRCCRCATENP